MAIVKEYTTPKGSTIKFNDEAYRDQTPEEKAAVIENIERTAYRCLMNDLARKAEQGETA